MEDIRRSLVRLIPLLLLSLLVFQYFLYLTAPRCSDGTPEGDCSGTKPFLCLNGSLVSRPGECGCPSGTVGEGDSCISLLETGAALRSYGYTLSGAKGAIDFMVYSGMNAHLAQLPREYDCMPRCPSTEEIEKAFIGEETQRAHIAKLADEIRRTSQDVSAKEDDAARVAISLVQSIPYDDESYRRREMKNRYPYQVLYENTGVCGEKSRLLAALLSELGYGVVLYNYDAENHTAVGIKCDNEYSREGSGYCFIETTTPSIATDASGEYAVVGRLASNPAVIHISEGKSFDCAKEYTDAREWNLLREEIDGNGGYLEEADYERWSALAQEYGIETGD